MKSSRTIILALAIAFASWVATAADLTSSPRGKETTRAPIVAKGYPDRNPVIFTTKSTEAPRLKGTNVDERNLVKEARTHIYTGKGAAPRPAFEIAPAK